MNVLGQPDDDRLYLAFPGISPSWSVRVDDDLFVLRYADTTISRNVGSLSYLPTEQIL